MKKQISSMVRLLLILVAALCSQVFYASAQISVGISGATNANPLFSGGVFTDTKDNYGFGNNYSVTSPHGQESGDIWYKVKLKTSATVSISLCNSGDMDTYLHLLNSTGDEIVYNDDNGPSCPSSRMSSLQTTLGAGVYYVVVEGYSDNTGPITTQISIPQTSLDLDPLINTVSTWVPRIAIGTITSLKSSENNSSAVNISNKYIDAVGNRVQQVEKSASTGGSDIVQPYEFDELGRQTKQYLPYTFAGTTPGSYRPSATVSEQAAFYGNTSSTIIASTGAPYAKTSVELSPLQRPLEQGAPGNYGQLTGSGISGSGHTEKYDYTTNNTVAISDVINTRIAVLYNAAVDANGNYTLVHSLAGTSTLYYNANELFVQIIKDANWTAADGRVRTKEIYTNSRGQKILTRVFNKNAGGTVEILSTYLVYDDFGNLCYTLPPGALPDNAVNVPGNVITQDVLNKYCYQYQYDEKGRLVAEKSPGVDWKYFVYNSLGQLVASQGGNDRLRKEWIISKYDGQGRTIIRGVWNNNNVAISRKDLQTLVRQQSKLWEDRTTTGIGYTSVCWPQTVSRYNYIDYFDDYTIPGIPSGYAYQTYAGNTAGNSKQTYGELTATKTWPATGTTELWSVFYYDDKGRIIQTQSGHHLSGKDIVNSEYLFSGQVSKTVRTHSSSAGSLVIANRYEYDHRGREIKQYSKIGTDDEVLLRQTAYNELGQVIDVRLHQKTGTAKFLQSIDYRYNERGWLTSINDPDLAASSSFNDGDSDSSPDLFGLKLTYFDDPQAPQYNGSPAALRWKTSQVQPAQTVAPPKMGYQYRYDPMGRLTSAISEKNGTVDNAHNESITYDKNGNIATMKRSAYTGGASQEIDNLSFTYDGYQAKKIDDASTAAGKQLGFDDMQKLTEEYTYDPIGNMTADKNKGITLVYNEWGLVQQVTLGTNDKLEFLYDRMERKLQAKYTKDAAIYTIDYIDGIQYEQGQVAFVQTAAGRARKNGSVYRYEYDINDHLSNARVTFTADPASTNQSVAMVIQQNSYYPYGMTMYGDAASNLNLSYVSGVKSKHLYSDKELYDQGGLNWYDHGSRMYDPVAGRWWATDPAKQFVNPYLAMGNNPAMYTDPNGQFAWVPFIVGAVIGAYSGGTLANDGQLNPTKWDFSSGNTWGYMFGGAVVGGFSGVASYGVSTSGIPMANTAAIATGSLMNSIGTYAYTGGRTDIMLSLGIASLNISSGEFGYLGRKGNSFIENLGYGLGAISNFNDIMVGFSKANIGDVDLATEHSDAIGHSAIVEPGTTDINSSIVSFGPPDSDLTLNPFKSVRGTNNWSNHLGPGESTWVTKITGINKSKVLSYGNKLSTHTPKYNLYTSSCVTHASVALLKSGFLNIGIHPYILAGQAYLREIGIRNYFSYYLVK